MIPSRVGVRSRRSRRCDECGDRVRRTGTCDGGDVTSGSDARVYGGSGGNGVRSELSRLRWGLAMASLPGVLAAQSAVAPESQIWPAGREAKLGAFGNLAHCTVLACDRSASLGVDARIAGPFSVAIGGSANGLQYGASYSSATSRSRRASAAVEMCRARSSAFSAR